MNAVEVRIAGPPDAAELLPLFRAFYRDPQTEEGIRRRLAAAASVDTVVVARVGGEAAGFASLRLVPQVEADSPHAELSDIYVCPEDRRRGVGARLVAFTEELARTRGAKRLVLTTGFDNPKAQAFYHRIGFQDWALAMEKGLEG